MPDVAGGEPAGIELVEAASTARAAQTAASDPSVAAIAPELAARIYHLKPIARRIEDMSDNFTRFLVIGASEAQPSGDDKTSIMVSIKDRVGALYHLLTPFHKLGINLMNIESRPSRRRPGITISSSTSWATSGTPRCGRRWPRWRTPPAS
jgi:chorismate mutase/prephenate dehydratase